MTATLRLADLPDVLTISQVCGVFQISDRTYRQLKAHGAWKIPEIDGMPHRFSRELVRRFIESGGHLRLLAKSA